MSLRAVALMTPEERDKRRELDAECFRAVHAEIERGLQRCKTFARVAGVLKIERHDVIAGYWRHVKRKGYR